jgi:hypothetical protein
MEIGAENNPTDLELKARHYAFVAERSERITEGLKFFGGASALGVGALVAFAAGADIVTGGAVKQVMSGMDLTHAPQIVGWAAEQLSHMSSVVGAGVATGAIVLGNKLTK